MHIHKIDDLDSRLLKYAYWHDLSYCTLIWTPQLLAVLALKPEHLQGPVVQGVISLTVSVDSIYNILIFFAEKM